MGQWSKEIDERKGFDCECGAHHAFSSYVFAHWTVVLQHTCECGAKHDVMRGIANLSDDRKGGHSAEC